MTQIWGFSVLPWSLPCLCHWNTVVTSSYKSYRSAKLREIPSKSGIPEEIGIKIETWFGIFTSLLNDWRDLPNLINNFSLKAFRTRTKIPAAQKKDFCFHPHALSFATYFINSRKIWATHVKVDSAELKFCSQLFRRGRWKIIKRRKSSACSRSNFQINFSHSIESNLIWRLISISFQFATD